MVYRQLQLSCSPVQVTILGLTRSSRKTGAFLLMSMFKKVENGLRQPVVIVGQEPTHTILDRMKFYKVPGLSVSPSAVDHGKIVWAKG